MNTQAPPPYPALPDEVPVCPATPTWAPLSIPLNADQVTAYWQASQAVVEQWKDFEMKLRKLVIKLKFNGVPTREGMNNLPLGSDGTLLKYTKKLNRVLSKPDNLTQDDRGKPITNTVEAVQFVTERFKQISPNEGSFIAERLFKFSVDISKTELDKLENDAKTDPIAEQLLAWVNYILTIKEAAPALEIKPPKNR
jgi:hypothetical protein